MPRLATLFAALLLALPGAAFAQGAGDDPYQDPFGDEPSQNDAGGGGSSGSDGRLSDQPPVSGGGSSGADSGSSGSGGGSGSATAPSTGAEAPAQAPEPSGALPRTGSEPLFLLGLGLAFVLTGVGLRLRTIDPDAF
jgi:hypothetical protein